jgi:hypothetical protein
MHFNGESMKFGRIMGHPMDEKIVYFTGPIDGIIHDKC